MSDCHTHCHGEESDAPLSVNRKLKIMLTVFAAVVAISFLPQLEALNSSLFDYLSLIWWAVLLGLVLGGIIDHFIPDGFMIRFLGQKRKTTLLNAVIAGFLMSACSHGILAIAIQLYKKGASVPAVITFLLASPWANLPMTVLLFGFFGWQALYFIVGAMVIALVTGFVFTLLDRAGLIEPSSSIADPEKVEWEKLKNFNAGDAAKGVGRGALSLANMVLWWILLGVLLAAMIGAFVPEHFFMDWMGPDFAGMLVTLLFATII